MEPDHFSYAPPDAVAHYRAAERSLDAEAKPALRQIIRFQKNGEVGTRAALPVAINSVEIRLAHQLTRGGRTCAARILLALFIRA
jgi:hypothetical protein